MKSFFLEFICLLIVFSFVGCDKLREENMDPDTIQDTSFAERVNYFLFLEKWYGKIGIYKYDLTSGKQETLWWHPRENVSMLIVKAVPEPAFFFTIKRKGLRGNFPFFEKVKIYRISKDLSNTEFIYEINGGMQLTARWNYNENLEVVFTEIDKTDPAYVNRYIKTFDSYGKLINDEVEPFDLVTDGFPELLPERDPTVSGSGNYGISSIGDSVFLKTAESDSIKFITGINHKINKIGWSKDEEFVFISTLDLKNETTKSRKPETSELFVYSIAEDSIVASWGGGGVKNFITLDSLLVFDNGFGRNSSIYIYNYLRKILIDELNMKGECGLSYIPEL